MKHPKVRLIIVVLLLTFLGSFAERAFADTVYTVARGDTLSIIAIRFNVSMAAIMEANHISNPNSVMVGQQLKIPGGSSVNARNVPKTSAKAAAPMYMPPAAAGAKWIDVNLTTQTMTALEGTTPVKTTLVSTGTSKHPTVTGVFHIYVKLRSTRMTGGSRAARDYYNLPNVPNVMYFYRGFGIHGAYWHHNFGHQMSHGCINENLEDAQWFFDWSGPEMPDEANIVWASADNPGTVVSIHY